MGKATNPRQKASTGRGRPREDGERYACGKLKPPKPNERMMQQREAGDRAGGEHPLDYALAKGLITQRQHRAGMSFASCYTSTGLGRAGGSAGASAETEPTGGEIVDNWSALPDADVAALWDRLAGATAVPADREARSAKAMARWKELNDDLSPAQRPHVFRVCIQSDWPLWMTTLAVHANREAVRAQAAKETPKPLDTAAILGRRDQDRALLLSGLDALAGRRKASDPPSPIQPIPAASKRSGENRVVDRANHVTADGRLVRTVEYRQRTGIGEKR